MFQELLVLLKKKLQNMNPRLNQLPNQGRREFHMQVQMSPWKLEFQGSYLRYDLEGFWENDDLNSWSNV